MRKAGWFMIITVIDPLTKGCGAGTGGAGGAGAPIAMSPIRAAGSILTITVTAQGGNIGVGAGNIGGMHV